MFSNVITIVGAGYQSTAFRTAAILKCLGETVAICDLASDTEKINDYLRFYDTETDDEEMCCINGMGYTNNNHFVSRNGYATDRGTDYSAQIILLGSEPGENRFGLIASGNSLVVVVEEDAAQIRRVMRFYKAFSEWRKEEAVFDDEPFNVHLLVLGYTGKGRHAVHELKKLLRPQKTCIVRMDKGNIAAEKKFIFANRTCLPDLSEDHLKFLADAVAEIYDGDVKLPEDEEKLKKLDASNLYRLAKATERRKELK